MPTWFIFLSLVMVMAYALVGGVFLAFSDFIIRSLVRSAGGAGAMQAINREVFRWVFMALFLGLAPTSLGLAIYAVFVVGGSAGTLIAAAGLTYVIGCFGVTVRFNVPMNNALARLKEGTPDVAAYWEGTYVPRWTFWNSVRTGACILAAAILMSATFLAVTDSLG